MRTQLIVAFLSGLAILVTPDSFVSASGLVELSVHVEREPGKGVSGCSIALASGRVVGRTDLGGKFTGGVDAGGLAIIACPEALRYAVALPASGAEAVKIVLPTQAVPTMGCAIRVQVDAEDFGVDPLKDELRLGVFGTQGGAVTGFADGDGRYQRDWTVAKGPFTAFAQVRGGDRPGWAIQRGVCDQSESGRTKDINLSLAVQDLIDVHGLWSTQSHQFQSVSIVGSTPLEPVGAHPGVVLPDLGIAHESILSADGFLARLIGSLASPPFSVVACQHQVPPKGQFWNVGSGNGLSRSCRVQRELEGDSWEVGRLPIFKPLRVRRSESGLTFDRPASIPAWTAEVKVWGEDQLGPLLELRTKEREVTLPLNLFGAAIAPHDLKVSVRAWELQDGPEPVFLHFWAGSSGVIYE